MCQIPVYPMVERLFCDALVFVTILLDSEQIVYYIL